MWARDLGRIEIQVSSAIGFHRRLKALHRRKAQSLTPGQRCGHGQTFGVEVEERQRGPGVLPDELVRDFRAEIPRRDRINRKCQ